MDSAADLAKILHDRLAEVAAAFLASDPGTSGNDGSEAVHDARVALRRARSQLRTFSRLLARGAAMGIRADLKWYAAYLGRVRDLDVITDRLAAGAASLSEQPGWNVIVELLAEERAEALVRLREAQGVARYQIVLSHIELLSDAPMRDGKEYPVAAFLERPWHDFQGAVRRLGRDRDEQRLHEVRIRVKEVRYAGEVAAAIERKSGSALAAAASSVQDSIGGHRDAINAAAYLQARADALESATFLGGMLVLLERQHAAQSLIRLDDDLRLAVRRYRQLRAKLH